jgi:hypothetical protein
LEPYLEDGRAEQGIKGNYAKVMLTWTKSAQPYGQVAKNISPALDFSERNTFNFYLMLDQAVGLIGVKAGLQMGDNSWSICTFYVNRTTDPSPNIAINGFQDKVWKLVSLPRESFDNTSWSDVKKIAFQFYEAGSGGNYSMFVAFDEIGCDITGGEVIGNNVSSGYYVTGHKMECTRCHDPAAAHIDGNRLQDLQYALPPSFIWSNPTNFRFYSGYGLTLPYSQQIIGGRGPSYYNASDFALCYRCHAIAQTAIESPAPNEVASQALETNFRDDSGAGILNGEYNLHYYHVLNPSGGLGDNPTCVRCHDPHGQTNLALTRTIMGDMAYIRAGDGCEITDRDQDVNDNDIPDWYDPDYNIGAVLTEDWDHRLCGPSCHQHEAAVGDMCYGTEPFPIMSGYVRDLKLNTESHCGDPSLDCHGPHAFESHDTHLLEGDGKGPDPMGCAECHGVDWSDPAVVDLKDLDCEECHFGGTSTAPSGWIADIDTMVSNAYCDECHSPDGAFDGVNDAEIGAKNNWITIENLGIYTEDGELRENKDNWCLSCHDDNPHTTGTNESSLIGGVYAPNIAGDENNGNNYGYNITGHKVDCLECHVTDKDHIDGEHRTYEVANDGQPGQVVVNPYLDGYRLKDGSMRVPALAGTAAINVNDYSLCFECHNPDEVLGFELDQSDVSHTNFWDNAPQVTSIDNAHTYHLRVGSLRGDTDWDGVVDARETCISCHVVHGSPTGMIRNGQFISTPGTTDKVPALNFSYVVESTTFATATWTSPALDAGTYEVQVHVPTDLYDNHAGDAKYTVSHDGGSDVDATVDQRIDGGVWVSLGTGFSYSGGTTGTVVLNNDFTIGEFVLADAVRWIGPNTYQVDNPSAVFFPAGDWLIWDTDPASWNFIGSDFRYIGPGAIPNVDPTATLADSIGGWTQYGSGSIAINHICRACHSDGPALYQRTPKLWPKVLTTPGPVPATVPNNETGLSLIAVTIDDPDDNVTGVVIDLSSIGGSPSQAMYDDGSTGGDKVAGDDIYSYQLTIASGTTDAEYDFLITATDLDGNTGTGEVTLNVIDPTAIYVDNVDAVVSPDCSPPCDPLTEWAYFTSDQAFKEDFRYKERDASGTGTVIWTGTIPETGDYEIYAWWDDASFYSFPLAIRSKNVPYTIEISTDDGMIWSVLDSLTVDQTIEGPGGGQWNQLGTGPYTFPAGVSARVILSDNATPAPQSGSTTYVIGDAVKFVPVP